MTQQRIFAFLLISLQAGTVGFLSQTVFFPATVATVALAGVFSRKRFDPRRDDRFRIHAGLAVLFIVKYMIAPHPFRADALFIRTQLAHVVAQYLLVIQVLQFYLKQRHDRLPVAFAGWATVAMICAFDVLITDPQRLACQLLAVGFVVLAAGYFGVCRRWFPSSGLGTSFPEAPLRVQSTRRDTTRSRASGMCVPKRELGNEKKQGLSRTLLSGGVLAIVITATWVSADALQRYERNIEGLIVDILRPDFGNRRIGFSGRSQLGSVAFQKTTGADQIAVRIFSEQEPGYLRGRVFEHYENSVWFGVPQQRELFPIAHSPSFLVDLPTNRSTFMRRGAWSEQGRILEIWPETTLEGTVFSPLGATHLNVDAENAAVNQHNVFESRDLLPGQPYAVFVPQGDTPDVLAPEMKEPLLKTPADLDADVKTLANEVFADCETAAEKIAAVENHFRENYEYQLGISIPDNADPLTYFLLEKPAAHCEFFAAGAAVLLRKADVPCRYVTGFVSTEKNDYGGNWVARNKDAHAWVEAYDENRGWVIVEATPAVGVPATETDRSSVSQLWEALRDWFLILRTRLQFDGPMALLSGLVTFFTSLPGLLLALTVAGYYLIRSRKRTRRKTSLPIDRITRELHRLLKQMDARLRKQAIERQPSETLERFADRLESQQPPDKQHPAMAEWYRRYSAVRYGGDIDEEAVKDLAEARPTPAGVTAISRGSSEATPPVPVV